MIFLTKIDGKGMTVNAEEIETVETSFDSTITLKSGRKIVVRESAEIITELTVKYKQSCIPKEFSGF
ncbi:MAG: flagellar protein FlbD [Bacteroidota bacterium]|nr:flagellar protein FlbD [Bacteroidota bacterium]